MIYVLNNPDTAYFNFRRPLPKHLLYRNTVTGLNLTYFFLLPND
ncbi:MAG: hypothetical protein FD119_1251 [Stygiobacter sp.]|nr:MAG: hypothetical protein FD119_1251 [Stygiobacter sp.]